VGFRQKNSSYLASLGECHVLKQEVASLLPGLHSLVTALSCPDRIPQFEVSVADNATAIVVRHLVPLTADDFSVLRDFAKTNRVQLLLQPQGPDSIAPLYPEQPDPLFYELKQYHVKFEFGPSDFIQVNAAMNEQTVAQALGLLELNESDSVLDLFCGLGNFSLPMARSAKRVLGIEADVRLVAKARRNAELNSIVNAEFRVTNLYDEALGAAPWEDFAFNKLLLDPPRLGAMPTLKRLSHEKPERIVYVSCYPATLARDANYLVNVMGYRFESAQGVDMFPHTAHVETLSLFVRP
jgi:23S rRNA (uracil1939-C5)-methyltransferase